PTQAAAWSVALYSAAMSAVSGMLTKIWDTTRSTATATTRITPHGWLIRTGTRIRSAPATGTPPRHNCCLRSTHEADSPRAGCDPGFGAWCGTPDDRAEGPGRRRAGTRRTQFGRLDGLDDREDRGTSRRRSALNLQRFRSRERALRRS